MYFSLNAQPENQILPPFNHKKLIQRTEVHYSGQLKPIHGGMYNRTIKLRYYQFWSFQHKVKKITIGFDENKTGMHGQLQQMAVQSRIPEINACADIVRKFNLTFNSAK